MCRVVSPVRRERRESFASVPGFPEREKMAFDLNAREEGPECRSRIVLQLDGSLPSIATGRIFPGRPCSALPRHHYYSCPVLPLPQQDLSLSLSSCLGAVLVLWLFRGLPKALHCISLVSHTTR
jgi:hypothetical protein